MSVHDVEQILSEAWPQESIHEAMEGIQPQIRRSEQTCTRINIRAARRKAIAWRAAVLRGEADAKPPRYRSRVAAAFTPRIGGSGQILFGAAQKTRQVMVGRKAPANCDNCGQNDHERQDCLKPPVKREGKR